MARALRRLEPVLAWLIEQSGAEVVARNTPRKIYARWPRLGDAQFIYALWMEDEPTTHPITRGPRFEDPFVMLEVFQPDDGIMGSVTLLRWVDADEEVRMEALEPEGIAFEVQE